MGAAFVSWFRRLLMASLYPGAPFQRKYMALSMLQLLLQAQAQNAPAAVVFGSPQRVRSTLLQAVDDNFIHESEQSQQLASILLGEAI